MKYTAKVIVELKDNIKDAKGDTVSTVLKRTGYEDSASVRIGKYFTLSVSADNDTDAMCKLDKICSDVLSNPVLEKYTVKELVRAE